MGSLFATNDALTQERLNRGFMPGRLSMPVYDVNDSGTVTVTPRSIDGDDVFTSVTTHYSVPGGAAVSIIHAITVCNNDSSAQHAGVYLVQNGSVIGGPTVIFFDTLNVGETVVIEGPFFLDPGDAIQSISLTASANKVSLRAEVCEYTALPAGVVPVVVDGATISTSRTAYHTYGGTKFANIESIVLCNFDSSARSVVVEIRPSGGSLNVNQQIFNATLNPNETVVLGGFVLEPGDAVYAQASALSVVSIRVSPVHWT